MQSLNKTTLLTLMLVSMPGVCGLVGVTLGGAIGKLAPSYYNSVSR